MRSRRLLVVLAGALMSAVLVTTPAAANGATVIIERGGSNCWIDPVDVPGLAQGFLADSSTVTITPDGMLVVTCTSQLPSDFSVQRTLVIDTLCIGDTATTTGRLIVTIGGRLAIMCRFPAG